MQEPTVALTMAQKWIAAIVLSMPVQDQVNYLPYGMIQSSGLSNALFTKRVSLRIQPVGGQPGVRFELAYNHDLIFLARFRNEPGRRPFTICQDETVEKQPLPTKYRPAWIETRAR